MDENVVFDPENKNAQESSQANVVVKQPVDTVPQQTTADTPQNVEVAPVTSANPGRDTGDVPPSDPPPIRSGISGGGILKKIIIGVIILIILIVIIFIFIPKGNGNKKAKLVWWGLWEDQATMQPLISDFQKAHPNITVEYIKQDPKQYREKLMTRIKNGTGPDIFRFHNTWVPMLSDVLSPLSSDVITASEFKKNYYPVMQKDLTQNGGIYGIPLGADSLALFVNTDILEKAGVSPPPNWVDFITVARALTVKDPETKKIKTAGAALGTYGNITHAPDIISLLFIQQGVDIKKFPSSGANQIEALDFYTKFAKGDNTVWDSTLDESILAFARGNLAMYIGFSWDIFRIKTLNKDLSFSTHPVPQLVGQKATLASYWVEGVSAKSPNQKAALQFMQYLSKKETAQKFYSTVSKTRPFGEPFPRRDLAASLKDNKLVYPFVTQLESASSSYFASDTNDGEGGINFLVNTYLGNTVNAMVSDNSSPQTVVETLDKGVGQVYQKYGIQ